MIFVNSALRDCPISRKVLAEVRATFALAVGAPPPDVRAEIVAVVGALPPDVRAAAALLPRTFRENPRAKRRREKGSREL